MSIVEQALTVIGDSPNGLLYSEIQKRIWTLAKGSEPKGDEHRGYWSTNLQTYLPRFCMKFFGRYYLTENIRAPFTRETATLLFHGSLWDSDLRNSNRRHDAKRLQFAFQRAAALVVPIEARQLPLDWKRTAKNERIWYKRDALRAYQAFEDAREHFRLVQRLVGMFGLNTKEFPNASTSP